MQRSHRLSSLVGLALMPSGGTVLICFRSDISLQIGAHTCVLREPEGSESQVSIWLVHTLVQQLHSAPESCRGGGMALHDASYDWGDQMCSGPGLNPFRPHTGSLICFRCAALGCAEHKVI